MLSLPSPCGLPTLCAAVFAELRCNGGFDLVCQAAQVLCKAREECALLGISSEVTDQCALGCVGPQLFQVRSHILHFASPLRESWQSPARGLPNKCQVAAPCNADPAQFLTAPRAPSSHPTRGRRLAGAGSCRRAPAPARASAAPRASSRQAADPC